MMLRTTCFPIATIIALLCGSLPLAQAEGLDRREIVLGCLAAMDATTTWEQCRTQMFAPCAPHEVGGEAHLGCLARDREGWERLMTERRDALTGRLTGSAQMELAGLMGQWIGYVSQKCAAVGEARAEISREAAVLGCEISELAGLALEFDACASGLSTAPYCIVKD